MRNTRSIIMLVIAVIAGLAAVVLAARWMQQQSQSGGGKVATALVDIQLGSRLSPEMIQMMDWPTGNTPNGAVKDPKALENRVVKTSLARGEPILESKLAPVGTQGGLSAVVSEGKRAITVRVNDVVGVAGFTLPGNFVDIMVNTQEEGGKSGDKDRNISKIVLEHILVLAVAQEAGRDETKPKVVNAVTLEVTPEQAEKLDLARSVGSLSLVLRNQVDPNPVQTVGATKETLLNRTESQSAAAAQPPSTSVSAPVAVKKVVKQVKRVQSVATEKTSSHQSNCIVVIRGTSKTTECF